MATDKYGKYILTKNQLKKRKVAPFYQTQELLGFYGGEHWEGSTVKMGFECITRPWLMDPYPMIHEKCDQIISFIGGNAMDINDFSAEIEFYLGEEGERHIITSPAVIYIPRGFIHCPMNIAKVNKPFLFINTIVGGNYTRKIKKDGVWSRPRTFEEEAAEMTTQEKKERGIVI
jgi:hypothetical protein